MMFFLQMRKLRPTKDKLNSLSTEKNWFLIPGSGHDFNCS